jgi:hypothetical protein
MTSKKPPLSQQNPDRLFVILARESPIGVILRRGPSKWVQIIRWSTADDTFEPGQWFHGRIYEKRCDLSPSGDKFIYFAAKHHHPASDPSYSNAWTAISRPPYLTALALWSNLGTTYHGGGLFATEDVVWLNSVHSRWSNPDRSLPPPHPNHQPPPSLQIFPCPFTSGDQLHTVRLVRDGWELQTPGDIFCDGDVESGTLTKSFPESTRVLHFDFGHEITRFAMNDSNTTSRLELDRATWADRDQRGRLVFARDGKLFVLKPAPAGTFSYDEIADFSQGHPQPMATPDWAKQW